MFIERVLSPLSLSQGDLLNLGSFFSEEMGTCLLFSGGTYETADQSYLCLFPFEKLWIQERNIYHLKQGHDKPDVLTLENPWDGLKAVTSTSSSKFASIPDWVGYLGYELGAFSDPEKQLPYQSSMIPDAYFFRHSVILTVEHKTGKVKLFTREEDSTHLSGEQKKFVRSLSNSEVLMGLVDKGKQKNSIPYTSHLSIHKPLEGIEKYKEKIKQAKELIRAGEIYQVNLSQQLQLKGECHPYRIFQKISSLNPAPFMAFLNFPEFTLVSSSPERFLCKKGERLETRPIKGTAPRGKNPKEDTYNREQLLGSLKEKAELLMITDLMRNDLGKVSQTGSVITEDLWRCESYTNVFHLLSIILSKAKPSLHPVDIVRSAFPGGSITGCPKLRAMEVIYDLEKRPRGIYTGSIGYFACNGDFDFNIAIRTILCKNKLLDIQLGGAVVIDSIPHKEYEETLYKGDSIFKILNI